METPLTDAAEEAARTRYNMSREAGDPSYPGGDLADFARGLETKLALREKALRDIKATHTRYYQGVINAREAVSLMECIAVSVWQIESIKEDKEQNGNA